MNFEKDWERTVLLELNQEYSRICRDRKLSLRPVAIRLFDSQTLWGQFDGMARTISLSRKLIQNYSWQQVMGVFKHEIAHQFVFESSPSDHNEKPHGELFQKACLRLGVPSQFSKARVGFQDASLDWKSEQNELFEDRMLDKVKKLLALAQSTNEHEAGAAMRKVQELYAQYNLDRAQLSDRNQYVHLVIAEGKKRKNAWEQRIISILIEHFFVEIIIVQNFNAKTSQAEQAFEIIGTRENVLMAEYVYYFLLGQIEYLLQKSNAKTRTQKASFRLGILEGFSDKLRVPPKAAEVRDTVIQKALVQFKNDPFMAQYLKEIYPRLSFRKNSSRMVDTEAFTAGKSQGRNLVLHKPIESTQKSGRFLSSFRTEKN